MNKDFTGVTIAMPTDLLAEATKRAHQTGFSINAQVVSSMRRNYAMFDADETKFWIEAHDAADELGELSNADDIKPTTKTALPNLSNRVIGEMFSNAARRDHSEYAVSSDGQLKIYFFTYDANDRKFSVEVRCL